MNLVMKECLQADGQTAQVVLTQEPVRQQARLLMLKIPPILIFCQKKWEQVKTQVASRSRFLRCLAIYCTCFFYNKGFYFCINAFRCPKFSFEPLRELLGQFF